MFRQAIRSLRRSPGFSAAAIVTVALGVGPGAALFSVVKAVLLNPLPYPNPAELVWAASVTAEGKESATSIPNFDDWRERTQSFAKLAAYADTPMLTGGGEFAERTTSAIVTEDFFDALGVQPRIGRSFLKTEHAKGAVFSSVLISDGLWRRAYGADSAIVGRRIKVFGYSATVIGVMPPGFSYPDGADLWASARALGEGVHRDAPNYLVIGRLRPGVAPAAADAELADVARRMKKEYPGPRQPASAKVSPLGEHISGRVRAPLLLLFGAVGILMMLVCANIANLMLARGAAQARELAVRAALGAGALDLFRDRIAESLVLSLTGGGIGLLLAAWCMDLLRVVLPSGIPRASETMVDSGVALFAIGVSLLTGIAFGAWPALRAAAVKARESLSSRSRGISADRSSLWAQNALVISQVALSLILLSGAGLLTQSFLRLRAVDTGFHTNAVLAMNLSFPMNRAEAGRIASRYDELLEKVRAFPGVSSAGAILDVPLTPVQRAGHFQIENRTESGSEFQAGYRVISNGLMETLQIPLLQGRGFTEWDHADTQPAVIVSAEMARRFWPGRSPIGERIWFDSFDPKPNWLTVTGVAADVRHTNLIDPIAPQAYVIYSQMLVKPYLSAGSILLRVAGDPSQFPPALRRLVQEVHPEAAVTFRTMDDVLAAAVSKQRFQMQVISCFAILAVVLAAIGLYGVLSYMVADNRPAIGIRMALGSPRAEVFKMIARRAFVLTATGAALGLSACVALRGVLRAAVYGVGPSDPAVLAGAVAVMFAVALTACSLPAWRAMNVDPVLVLREE